jgi:tetratricopeptide (TPR) repeat protein
VKLRFAGPALAALWLAACAAPVVKPAQLDGWHAIAAGDVVLVAEATARETEALAADLVGFDAAFAHLIGRKVASQKPTIIHFVRNRRLGERIWLGDRAAGWALGTLEESLACVALSSKIETRITLFHEYTHLLLARQRAARLPRWYNEGLAVYFSTLRVRDGAVEVGSVPFEYVQWLATRGPLPLPELFGPPDGIRSIDFYATSWALVHYLLSSARGRAELSRFEKELSAGVALDTARERAFGRSFEALSAELAAHLGYLQRGVSGEAVLDPRQLVIAKTPAARPLTRSESARALGLLALALEDVVHEESRDRGILAVSRDLLEIAVAGDAGNARARAALAYAESLANDREDARASVARALADAPGEREVLWRAGQVALALGDLEHAEQRFRGALAAGGEFASAWFGLGLALDRRGDAAAALDALERARRIAWSDALDLETGRLYLAAGRTDDALAVLQPLASDPHGGYVAEQAGELLRAAGLAAGTGPASGSAPESTRPTSRAGRSRRSAPR